MDEFFNHDVADWITKSMSRMDPDEAEMFARFFVYEVHKSDIDNNRRTLDRHAAEVSKSLMDDLQPETRELISKSMVAKADFPTNWGDVHQQEQPRGFGGRWVAIGTSGSGKKQKTIGYHPDVGVFEVKTGKNGKVKGQQPQIDITGALNQTGKAGTSFAERWTESRPGDHKTNDRTYRRVGAGAELLGKMPGATPQMQLASQVGQFAGQFGPQAEMVIGPAARRTAYRYRGTERQADPELAKWQSGAEEHLKKVAFTDAQRNSAHPPALDEAQRMEAAELAATSYLQKKLPSPHLSDLQLQSGRVPPSQGVIINDKGDIVTQAMGYQEDHYLPFNLKNLKGLQGGAYVRTRSSGGLTSEDIYTGLVGGARSVTVVSRSGVFTLDFDDHLRGGRRYSDKARQMVSRYAQTLDAVGSGKVAQRKLSPAERAEIRDEIEHEMEPAGYTKTQIEAKIKEAETEFSSNPRLTKAEVDEIERHAQTLADNYGNTPRAEGTQRMPTDPKMRYKAYYSELYDAAMEEKAKRMYQLDAQGYKAAQEALQEQFPYFVADVRHKPFDKGANEKDRGYVKAGYNRPDAAKEGYFDTNIQGYTNKQGTGKFSASEMGYQNYRHGGQKETAEDGSTAATADDKAPAAAKFKAAQAKVQLEGGRDAALEGWAKELVPLWTALDAHHADLRMVGKYRTDGSMSGWSPFDKRQLATELEHATGLVNADAAYKGSKRAADLLTRQEAHQRAERGLASRDPYDRSKWTEVSRYPKAWDTGPAHTPGTTDLTKYADEWNQTINDHKLKNEVSANDTDADLFARQDLWATVGKRAEHQLANMGDTANSTELMNALIKVGYDQAQTDAVMTDLAKGKKGELQQLASNAKKKTLGLARARSVKEAGGDAIKGGAGGSPPSPSSAPAQAPAAGAATTQPTPAPQAAPGPIHANPAPASSHYPSAAKLVAKPVSSGGSAPTPNNMPKRKPSLDSVMTDIDDLLGDDTAPGDQKQAAKQVKVALQGGSVKEQDEAIEELAAVLPQHAAALRANLEPKASQASQISPAMLNAIGADMRTWIKRSTLSSAKKAKLSALAGAIEHQESGNVASIAADLHAEEFKEFRERFDDDIKNVLSSFS